MPTFPSRHSGGHTKSYGWEKNRTISQQTKDALSKTESRTNKKKAILMAQKQLKEKRRLEQSVIKTVGLVGLQGNMQLSKVFSRGLVKCGADRRVFLDSAEVFRVGTQQFTFIEVSDLDQVFSLDFLLFCSIDAPVEPEQYKFYEELVTMRLNELPHMNVLLNSAEMLQLLIAEDSSVGAEKLAASQTQIHVRDLKRVLNTQDIQQISFKAPQQCCGILSQALFKCSGEKPAWLSKRFCMSVLAGKRDGAVVEVVGPSRGPFSTMQNFYITGFGDQLRLVCAEVLTWDFDSGEIKNAVTLDLKEQYPRIQMNLQQIDAATNIIGDQNAPEEQPQAMELPDCDEPSLQSVQVDDQTDLSTVVDAGPIQQDYEFKLAQYKTLEEQLEFPDELDIHPETSLKKLLGEFFSLKSVRNSPLPVGQSEHPELNSLFHLKQPTRLEQYALQEIERNKQAENVLLRLVFELDPAATRDAHLQMLNQIRQGLPGLPSEFFDSVLAALEPEQFANATPIQTQSVMGLLEHENKLGLAHVRMAPQHLSEGEVGFALPAYARAEIRIGFRRVFTAPTPYQGVSQGRGKLLRFFNQATEMSLSFPAPIYLTRTAYPPVLVRFDPKQNLVPTATNPDACLQLAGRLIGYNSQLQMVERIVLTGWPHRIHRNRSVIRYMFFNQQDVKYFISQALSTRNGLNGRILSPVTEKGYFKAHFDGQLTAGDCVELKLYKLIKGCGVNMGLCYQIAPEVNRSGLQAVSDLFEKLLSMSFELYRRMREIPVK